MAMTVTNRAFPLGDPSGPQVVGPTSPSQGNGVAAAPASPGPMDGVQLSGSNADDLFLMRPAQLRQIAGITPTTPQQVAVQSALHDFRRSPQFKMDPARLPELSQKLAQYLTESPALKDNPAAAKAFLDNIRRGVLGLNQPLEEFSGNVRAAYEKAGINPGDKVVLDSSAVRGAPGKPEKGSTFRPDGDVRSPDPQARPSDLDTVYRASSEEFDELTQRRLQEMQQGRKIGAKLKKPDVPKEYELRQPDGQLPEGAKVVSRDGKRFLQLERPKDLVAAAKDSDAYVAAHPEEFPQGTPRPLNSKARQFAETYENGLLRAEDLPSKNFDRVSQPDPKIREQEIQALSKEAGRETTISAVREGSTWDPEARSPGYRLGDPNQPGGLRPLPEAPSPPKPVPEPRPAAAMSEPAPGIAGEATGAVAAETHFAKTLRIGGGALALGGGAFQAHNGVQELRGGQLLNGTVDTVGGALNMGGGGLLLAGSTSALGPVALAGAAGLDATRDIVQGIRTGSTEKIAVGGVKGLGAAAMGAAPFVTGSVVGAPVGVVLGVGGAALYGAAALYENREAIGAAVTDGAEALRDGRAADAIRGAGQAVGDGIADGTKALVDGRAAKAVANSLGSWVSSWW